MASEKKLQAMTDLTTVWVGEIHHADSDPPLAYVVATTQRMLRLQLDSLAEEEADFVNDGDPDAVIDIRQTEHCTTLGQAVTDLDLSEDAMNDIALDGFVIL